MTLYGNSVIVTFASGELNTINLNIPRYMQLKMDDLFTQDVCQPKSEYTGNTVAPSSDQSKIYVVSYVASFQIFLIATIIIDECCLNILLSVKVHKVYNVLRCVTCCGV